jgi:hypothetical protein
MPSLNLAAKLAAKFKLGRRQGMNSWKTLRTKNLAAKLKLERACAKFKLGGQVQNLVKTLAGT